MPERRSWVRDIPRGRRLRPAAARLAVAVLLISAVLPATGQEVRPTPPPARGPPAPAGCVLDEIGRGVVAAAVDGRTLRLADGREVLLAGIEVAPVEDTSLATAGTASPAAPPAGIAARDGLAAAAAGRSVVLRQAAPRPDRWGRLVAWAFVEGDALDGGTRALQHRQLAAGLAWVAGRIDDVACLAGLREAEREARRTDLGLWSHPDYAALPAGRPAEILRRRGAFGVIRGRVDSVRESGGTVYLNFGRRWSEAFAATVPKRAAASFQAAGLDLPGLAGRTVEVRGIVEQRGGAPRIAVARPEQLSADER